MCRAERQGFSVLDAARVCSLAALDRLNWLLLALWPLLRAAVFSDLPREEGMLRDRFGTAYDAYAAQTGRLIPRIRG